MKNLIDEVEKHRRVIKYDSVAFTLNELVEMYRRKEIIIQPEFQRLFRWTREQQSNFVESLILEIPIPPLFFYENKDGVWELLDGLQRISTLIRFFTQGEIPAAAQGVAGNDDNWHFENQNDLEKPLQLMAGQYLTSLEGMSMYNLPTQLQLNLRRLRQLVYILKRETDPMYKYEIFSRLNRGGSQIEEQELRNCSIRLVSNTFPDFLQRMAGVADFRSALNVTAISLRDGTIEELALRYFATKNHKDAFRHDVDAFLTNYMFEVARNSLQFDYEVEERLFKRVWTLVAKAAPDGSAFTSKKEDGNNIGPFSPSIFEMLSYGVAVNIEKLEALNPTDMKARIVSLIIEAKKIGLTGAGSNSKTKFHGRLKFGSEELAK